MSRSYIFCQNLAILQDHAGESFVLVDCRCQIWRSLSTVPKFKGFETKMHWRIRGPYSQDYKYKSLTLIIIFGSDERVYHIICGLMQYFVL